MDAVGVLLIDFLEADVFGALTANAGAGDDGGALAQLGRPGDARIGNGFARGDDGELREAVHEVRAAIFEVRLMAVVGDFGAVLETELRHVRRLELRDVCDGLGRAKIRPFLDTAAPEGANGCPFL